MAPVGSYESLAAAIQAGADSVYFGVGKLNMRSASAANFTLDDLAKIVATARAAGVKTYLTVNTIVYEDELRTVHEVIDRAKAEGIDAVIASDFAAILYARRIGVEVHISTQSNISNSEAVKFFSQWADTVVLARELTLEQVARIHREIAENDIRGPRGELVQLEMFAHGALCMSVSGKCYLSLYETNCSANRGACRQLCRRKYTVTDKETGAALDVDGRYVLSPKDLCTVDFLDKVMGAGRGVCQARGGVLRRGAARHRSRDIHARTGRRTERAARYGLQPRILGRLLRRTTRRRTQRTLRIGSHAAQGLRGQGDQLLQKDIGGRSAGRSGSAGRGRRDILHGRHDGRRRTDARRAARHRRKARPVRRSGNLVRGTHPRDDTPRRPALQIRRCAIARAGRTARMPDDIYIKETPSGVFFVTIFSQRKHSDPLIIKFLSKNNKFYLFFKISFVSLQCRN